MIGLALAVLLGGAARLTPEQTRYIRQHYPTSVRPLVTRATLLSGSFVNVPTNPAASKARQEYALVARKLKAQGWCWGSEIEYAASSDMSWIRCKRVKTR